METSNLKTPLSLEQVLMSYNLIILLFFIFLGLMLLLLLTNKKGFNKSFGYQIFITGPFLILITLFIKEILVFKNNPQDSFFYHFNFGLINQPWFIYLLSFIALLIGIFGIFMMLYVGNIFSDSAPKNNTAMIMNFVIIALFIIIAGIIYKKYQNKDEAILKTMPISIQNAFHLRTKYTVAFIIFVMLVSLLYFVNPWNITTNYGSPLVFFTLFVGIIMVIMITSYQYFLSNPLKADDFNNTPSVLLFINKALYILGSLGISIGLIYGLLKLMGLFDQDASNPESWGSTIFNLLLFCTMLGLIYKLANAGGFLDKNPYYRLILNTLLYIPCLLVMSVNNISQLLGLSGSQSGAFSPPNQFEIKMLILSISLLTFYFLWFFYVKKYIQSVYFKRGGKQLINQPIQTEALTNVTSYRFLSENENFNYQYAMSFWFYLDSFPPSINASYNKIVPILSYGENPCIKYSSSNNTLYITVKTQPENNDRGDKTIIDKDTIEQWISDKRIISDKNDISEKIEKVKDMYFGNDLDADGNRIIYEHSDVHLQKWNHILLNYNGGTLDVFYNGRLVKSAIEVVPYMDVDTLTVGTDNGVIGNIANLMYFKHPLDIFTINNLYASFVNKNPPTIPENNNKLIPL